MDVLDYWRLCDELSVVQAAYLIIGQDPSQETTRNKFAAITPYPKGYEAAATAILGAIDSKELPAKIRRSTLGSYYEDSLDDEKVMSANNNDVLSGIARRINSTTYPIDENLTTVAVKDLKAWLTNRGFTTGFFFPLRNPEKPGYLDKGHLNYAIKLAAAIEVWQAINSNEELLKGKTPKQAMIKWLRENANSYGLTKDDGNPNEQGIEEIAKIANWDGKGGAPKTPGN